ncbi:MAG: DUF3427 domain-containing protein [Fibrobacter sp.]|nr:DUF3427 domain-containing protein [Fibrobacter sp.]
MALPNYSEFEKASKTAYWDGTLESDTKYRPHFISNKAGNTMQVFLDRSFSECNRFIISVAFITRSGLAPFMQTLLELEARGVEGQIITTDYLSFTEPEALKILLSFKKIRLKMFRCNGDTKGFHTKGYLFYKDDNVVSISIGSSNLTQNAISTNKEWNTSFCSLENGQIYKHIIDDFNELWNCDNSVEITEKTLNDYTIYYHENKRLESEKNRILRNSKIISIDQIKLQPNSMQAAFIKKLNEMRSHNAKRALLISATGTGKTYAAAFALRDMNPQRALFLVHREIILKQAMETFKNVFGTTKTFGLYVGSTNDSNRDFVFATRQTMTKHYLEFEKKDFDVIVIDEAHHSGANSYQTILDYFTPNFWLGMTATPDRTDGFDVYRTFDYNIAHEIRLQEAMKLNLLCPFHYYGITDIYVDGEQKEKQDFNRLTCDARVNNIIKKAKFFGHSGKRLKGLIFCSSAEEADKLSDLFNQKEFYGRNYHTVAIHSKMKANDKEKAKEEAIEKLESDDFDNGLDYIFTVDMFNEGVDIPQVNQVIMLRRTQSPIVFIQQLGRGLRKADDKEYVMVLDFIGNYDNNYMIPVALSGDRTYNKDNIRRFVREGHKFIEGASSIHFDEVAKEKIFKSIDEISNISKIIKASYTTLKTRLGRIPTLFDFQENGEVDPLLILSKHDNYYDFLQKMEENPFGQKILTKQDKNILSYLSKVLAKGLIIDASNVLNDVMNNGFAINGNHLTKNTLEILHGSFLRRDDENNRFNDIDLININGGKIVASESFQSALNNDIFPSLLQDVINLSINRFESIYQKNKSFVLYEKYSRQDVSLILDSDRDMASIMYGKWRYNNHVCIFVTYNKEKLSEKKKLANGKPDYGDEFIDSQTFMWDTKIGQDENSEYMRSVETALHKHLFVKKDDGEGTDFYYMGQFDIVNKQHATKKHTTQKHGERIYDIAKVTFKMKHPVKQDLLQYFEAEKGKKNEDN